MTYRNKIKLLNIDVENIKLDELSSPDLGVIMPVNVDMLMKIQHDEEFYKIIKNADYIFCDSKILQLASNFLSTPIVEKISGSDFFPYFYQKHKNNNEVKIFLLGGAEGVADKASQNINIKVSRNIVIDQYSPSFGFENNDEECSMIINKINDSRATVLAVAVGAPKQEKWIMKYKDKLPFIRTFLAIGATIDFEAGTIKRSPTWMSSYGLEWLYRLINEPKRLWKRYLVDDMPFFYLIIKQKLKIYKNPWEIKNEDYTK